MERLEQVHSPRSDLLGPTRPEVAIWEVTRLACLRSLRRVVATRTSARSAHGGPWRSRSEARRRFSAPWLSLAWPWPGKGAPGNTRTGHRLERRPLPGGWGFLGVLSGGGWGLSPFGSRRVPANRLQFSALLWPSCAKSGILFLHGGHREPGIPRAGEHRVG